MTTLQKVLLGGGIVITILLIVIVVLAVKYKKDHTALHSEDKRADKVKIVHGVRYNRDKEIADKDGMQVTYLPGDVVLSRNVTYKTDRDSEFKPGTYTALSGGENDRNFKLRIGGIVKNYVHGDQIVLGEGEEICSVSTTVVLR